MEALVVYESARPHLAKLGSLSAELNTASDAFTGELRAIESELASLNLGVEAEVGPPIKETDAWQDPDDGQTYDRRWLLGYGKVGDSWHITANEYLVPLTIEGEPERWLSEDRRPLISSSRELRIAAAPRLEALLAKLAEVAQAKLDELKKVTDSSTVPTLRAPRGQHRIDLEAAKGLFERFLRPLDVRVDRYPGREKLRVTVLDAAGKKLLGPISGATMNLPVAPVDVMTAIGSIRDTLSTVKFDEELPVEEPGGGFIKALS